MPYRLISTLCILTILLQGGSAGADVPHHRGARGHPPVRIAVSRRVHHGSLVSPLVMRLTTNVAICEEGGWSKSSDQNGPTYYGNLGWLDATWQEWRQPTDPVNMHNASPQEQARAMARFVGHVMGGWWPDNGHCSGGY